ncbi:guanylate kinase [Spiroplasma turonicum]|uniref:Guanylate kinase n=1 Tax=Spiroplasma turonicum TaxID=216946 RepID=A0A0K1P564_9MOLU|nr:guanylate kinase [Spiroplasma turonicum]AKU79423.1 guanylate kinase [Spiroplasma turonicum]ALX70444.1 guanylate kinase [Spiroplasma turonicum]
MKKGKIIILSGPSGVGKGTINKELAKDKSLNLTQSISMTTRSPRPGEVDGVNYFFVDKSTFKDAIEHNELIEYAEFIGNFYGTPRKYLYEKIEKGENVVLEIEVIGATQILKKESPDNLVSIFLMPPNLKQLENRLRNRGTENNEVIKQRLDKALLEIPLKHKYQYVITIESVEDAVNKVKEVLLKENTLHEDWKNSKYYKLKEDVKKIIIEQYMFLVNNWKDNVIHLDDYKENNNFDFEEYLINFLTQKIYKYVLAYEELVCLDNFSRVKIIAEKFMLDFNFFTMEQD